MRHMVFWAGLSLLHDNCGQRIRGHPFALETASQTHSASCARVVGSSRGPRSINVPYRTRIRYGSRSTRIETVLKGYSYGTRTAFIIIIIQTDPKPDRAGFRCTGTGRGARGLVPLLYIKGSVQVRHLVRAVPLDGYIDWGLSGISALGSVWGLSSRSVCRCCLGLSKQPP